MDKFTRINEIKEQLDSFYHNEVFFFIVVVIILLFLISVFTENNVLFAVFIVVAVAVTTFMFYIEAKEEKLMEELDELEKTFLVESYSNTTSVKTSKIIQTISVEEKYCPHVELSNYEYCTYVEIVSDSDSDSDITQIFMPIDKVVYASPTNPVTIKYLDLPEKDSTSLYEHFKFESILLENKQKVYKKSWALGVSIE